MWNYWRPALFVGPTGTGKSCYVQQKLMNDLSPDAYLPTFVNFSAQTSANQTQVLLLAEMMYWTFSYQLENTQGVQTPAIIYCTMHMLFNSNHYYGRYFLYLITWVTPPCDFTRDDWHALADNSIFHGVKLTENYTSMWCYFFYLWTLVNLFLLDDIPSLRQCALSLWRI